MGLLVLGDLGTRIHGNGRLFKRKPYLVAHLERHGRFVHLGNSPVQTANGDDFIAFFQGSLNFFWSLLFFICGRMKKK